MLSFKIGTGNTIFFKIGVLSTLFVAGMTATYQNIERLIFVFIFNRLYLRSLFSNLI